MTKLIPSFKEAKKSFRMAKILNGKESQNQNFYRAEITTFSLPNQTMARLTLNRANCSPWLTELNYGI